MFRTAMQSSPIGMATVSADLTFSSVNPALCRILGRRGDDVVGRSVGEFMAPEFHDGDERHRRDLRMGVSESAFQEEQLIRGDGSRVWVAHSIGAVRDDEGALRSFVSQFADIEASRATRLALADLATRDELTAIDNRRSVVAQLGTTLAQERPASGRTAVLFADLDDLKGVNDRFDHAGGDSLLVAVALRLRQALRAEDTLSRFGGDEFVILLHSIPDPASAAQVAEKLRTSVAGPLEIEGEHLRPGISIGVAMVRPGDSPADTIARADAALYRAKQDGKGRVRLAEGD